MDNCYKMDPKSRLYKGAHIYVNVNVYEYIHAYDWFKHICSAEMDWACIPPQKSMYNVHAYHRASKPLYSPDMHVMS